MVLRVVFKVLKGKKEIFLFFFGLKIKNECKFLYIFILIIYVLMYVGRCCNNNY